MVNPPNKVISIPLIKGISGILFSRRKITDRETSVAITKGGMASFKSLSLLKYIVKNRITGPKSAINLIIGLFIKKC